MSSISFDRSAWHRSTVAAIRRYAARHQTRLIARQGLIAEELDTIVAQTNAKGRENSQTLSRILQELRKAGVLHYVRRGLDLLLDEPVAVEHEDLPDAAIDAALEQEHLRINDVPTSDARVLARRRRGQERVRAHTLANYGGRCALCDVQDAALLVASHIVRWSDDAEAQGKLANVICLCRMHDALFEAGYITFADDMTVLAEPARESKVIEYLQRTASALRLPSAHPPLKAYLASHRHRTGHGWRSNDSMQGPALRAAAEAPVVGQAARAHLLMSRRWYIQPPHECASQAVPERWQSGRPVASVLQVPRGPDRGRSAS